MRASGPARSSTLPPRVLPGRRFSSARVRAAALRCGLMGDTLTHLPSLASVEQLLARAAGALAPRGRFVATFRDYTSARLEEDRFILVRSDADRLLSCFLEYAAEHVNVHDVLHEKHAGAWQMRVSAYRKLRLSPDRIGEALGAHGLVVNVDRAASGMVRVVATRN